MRLTKLELYGFKSFAKKTEILFDKGITAIVGPNGSGKSNIADSIRWVLGEQSAKTLRGSRMEDVIFGGTASRKAMSYCEVTLTFDNSDGQLPIDYSEVSITRRVYRSGESEYCINKSTCRLRDLQELFRDTGLGKEGYSIVGQGKVEEILSNKSGERRKAFEEAAGIMKYRVRKEDAEKNLDNTRKNLTRLHDILTEIEDRIEPLKQQAETASLYLKLRDELKELDINLFLHQYDKIKERISNIDSTIAQIMQEIALLDSQKSKLTQQCQSTEETERAVGDDLSALNANLVGMTAELETLVGNLKVLQERIANSDREHDALLQRIAENETRHRELSLRLENQDTRTDERDAILAQLTSDFQCAQKQLEEITLLVEQKENEIEALKNSIIETANKLGDTKSSISRYTATRESLQNRLAQMQDTSTDISSEDESLSAELDEANAELESLGKANIDCNNSLSSSMASVNEHTHKLNTASDSIRRSEQLLENKKSRLNALMDMKKAHDGYYASIQKLMADAQRDAALESCIEGTVAEIIQVPQEYEVALEMALGATLQNIVTPDENAAKYAIGHLRKNRYGRATFLPVTAMRPRLLAPDERRNILNVIGCFGIASELITFNPKYKNVVENLLGRTVVVDNLDTGVKINKLCGGSLRIATVDGDIISPGGAMTGGSTGKSLNLLGREREIADLLGEIDKIKKELAQQKINKEETEIALLDLQKSVSELVKQSHELDIAIAKQKDKVDIIASQREKVKSRQQQAELERSRIADDLADIEQALSDAQKAQEELASGSTSTQSDVIVAQKMLSTLKGEQATKLDTVTDLKVRIAALQKEADTLADEHDRLIKDIEVLGKTIDLDKRSESNFSQEQNLLIERKTELETQIAQKRSSTEELTAQCKQLEDKRSKLLTALDELRRNKDNCDEQLEELRERKHRQELSRSKSENELASMQDKIWTDYELTYENAQQYRKDIPITSSTQRAGELKRAIRDLGDININAIEEFKALNERFTELSTQFDDLQKAESDLITLIDGLIEKMETCFKEKFNQICVNFKKVFTELFGGGTAELILSDENDILNCDIDILAQIPGKKLQSLAPLSGGERALTAIALQFAILGLKPTAFCLLDEIDASLDEVNVSRFADYVHVYAESTQFILITHRKGSMESCNAIYGVAQEEKGVSKVVSARITQSED